MNDSINDPELLAEFAGESLELLQDVSDRIIACEQSSDREQRQEQLHAIFRSVHSIKGNSSFFGLDQVQKLAHDLENLLDDLRQGRQAFSNSLASLILDGIDLLSRLIASCSKQETVDPATIAAFLDRLKTADSGPISGQGIDAAIAALRQHIPHMTTAQQESVNELLTLLEGASPDPSSEQQEASPEKSDTPRKSESAETPSSPSNRSPSNERKVMRIDEERIDAFLSYVGELVVIGDMFHHFLRQLQSLVV